MINLIGFIPSEPNEIHYRVKNLTGQVIEENNKIVKVKFDIIENKKEAIVIVQYPKDECKKHYAQTIKRGGLTFWEFCQTVTFVPDNTAKWEMWLRS